MAFRHLRVPAIGKRELSYLTPISLMTYGRRLAANRDLGDTGGN